jgi:hypothetical protein
VDFVVYIIWQQQQAGGGGGLLGDKENFNFKQFYFFINFYFSNN